MIEVSSLETVAKTVTMLLVWITMNGIAQRDWGCTVVREHSSFRGADGPEKSL